MILGRGTATSEGLAIAQSVLEYLHNNIGNIIDTTCNDIIDYNIYVYIGCRTLLATHFHELTKLSVELSNIGCYQVVAFKNNNDDLIMTHKVEVITIYCINSHISIYNNKYILSFNIIHPFPLL